MGNIARFVTMAAIAGAMAGCAVVDEMVEGMVADLAPLLSTDQSPPTPKRKPEAVAHRASLKHAALRAKTAPSAPSSPAPIKVSTPIEAPPLQPAFLVGLNRADTVALLGYPSAVREHPPSTVWSYRSEGCALHLFFYKDMETNSLNILTYDLKPGAGNASGACLDRLLAAYDADR